MSTAIAKRPESGMIGEFGVIKEVMTPLPFTADALDPIDDAYQLMCAKAVRHLPVIKDGKLYGIISERDVKLAVILAERFSAEEMIHVEDICRKDPFTVSPNDSLKNVALKMVEKRIGSALVVDDSKVLGIFTATDACRWIGAFVPSRS